MFRLPPHRPAQSAEASLPVAAPRTGGRPHVIVLGNEKGGSGKSTAAMHVSVGLLRLGHRVGTIDLDARQGTLTRYMNARRLRAQGSPGLPLPDHRPLFRSEAPDRATAETEERTGFEAALSDLGAGGCEFIVIDTPGSDTHLSRLGHSFADTLITPINDSFVDLDLLATVDPETNEILRPSVYSEMVWEMRKQRALRDRGVIDWIVMRNRLGHLDARNKRDVADVVEKLARRLNFRVAPGFGERVIFREMFLKGLTLLDLAEEREGPALTLSHVAARQEVRSLIEAIRSPRRAGDGLGRRQAAG